MQNNPVTLLIAGKEHSHWERYEIDSDLMIPADAWCVSLGMSGGQVPADVVVGASVVVLVGGETVLTGYVDEISHSVNKTTHTLTLSGRDLAADLLDCSAPFIIRAQMSLKEIVAAITGEFKKTKIRIDADLTRARNKIAINPGETAWNALANAAELNGLWAWFDPDGTLIVGGPDYTSPEVASLILKRDGRGNNVISLDKTASQVGRYSRVTVYGQSSGTDWEHGKPDLHASWEDKGVLRHRPKIVLDHEVDNNGMCGDLARKTVSDSRLHGLTLTATVQGHRIVAPGQQFDQKLWKPGQRIRVFSEPHGINGVYFLMARKFTRNRMDGTRTVLTLKEDGAWIPGAHPQRKHSAGKNGAPLQIVGG